MFPCFIFPAVSHEVKEEEIEREKGAEFQGLSENLKNTNIKENDNAGRTAEALASQGA